MTPAGVPAPNKDLVPARTDGQSEIQADPAPPPPFCPNTSTSPRPCPPPIRCALSSPKSGTDTSHGPLVPNGTRFCDGYRLIRSPYSCWLQRRERAPHSPHRTRRLRPLPGTSGSLYPLARPSPVRQSLSIRDIKCPGVRGIWAVGVVPVVALVAVAACSGAGRTPHSLPGRVLAMISDSVRFSVTVGRSGRFRLMLPGGTYQLTRVQPADGLGQNGLHLGMHLLVGAGMRITGLEVACSIA
jgi:hypothetical protein